MSRFRRVHPGRLRRAREARAPGPASFDRAILRVGRSLRHLLQELEQSEEGRAQHLAVGVLAPSPPGVVEGGLDPCNHWILTSFLTVYYVTTVSWRTLRRAGTYRS